jgi:hypothetical protein
MRIICDHCSQPISGTVKRLAGNLNLHPDCLAQLGKGPKRESAADSWQSQESSIDTVLEWRGISSSVSREMK